MKNILKITTFSLILLTLAAGLVSCEDKDPFLSLDKTEITATAEAETYSIVVNSNSKWFVSVENTEYAAWLTLESSIGNRNGVITVDVFRNLFYTPRSATIKITSENLTEIVVINQDATEKFDTTLTGTKWKLEGIVDVRTNVLRELEPKDCEDCFTIMFEDGPFSNMYSGSPFHGRVHVNTIGGNYKTDCESAVFVFTIIAGSQGMEYTLEAFLYRYETLQKIQSFRIEDTYPRRLRLYYNDGKEYLKYKEIGG